MDASNLYDILGVPRTADQATIRKAYKSLAMKWHPDKNHSDPVTAEKKFQQISNAYGILSDPLQRKRYDDKNSSPLPRAQPTSDDYHYTSHRQSSFDQLYDSIYGRKAQPRKNSDCEFHPPPQMPIKPRPAQDPFADDQDDDICGAFVGDITVNVLCTLEELFRGLTRQYKIIRCVDGSYERKTFEVTVTPGMKSGTRLVLKGEGNKRVGQDACDAIFIIRELHHKNFMRRGDDLIEPIELTMSQALAGVVIERTGLDGNLMAMRVDGPIDQSSEVRLVGKGMPKKNGGFGDVIFLFTTKFSRYLPEEQKRVPEVSLPD